jgi:FkbM family methyltransferase
MSEGMRTPGSVDRRLLTMPIRKARHLRRDIKIGGLRLTASFHLAALASQISKRFGRLSGHVVEFRVRGLTAPVRARLGTSDMHVFHAVFLSGRFRHLDSIVGVKSIIDCGANVGYTALYFAKTFPEARIVAIESDSTNAALCRLNLSDLNGRVSILESAVWPRAGAALTIYRGDHDEFEPWARQVRESVTSEGSDVPAVTIPDVMERFGFESVDILKVDIEGSEQEVFEVDTSAWLGQVKNVAIELHGDECRRVFFDAMSRYSYRAVAVGELDYCFQVTG